jgi:hypothetical protein
MDANSNDTVSCSYLVRHRRHVGRRMLQKLLSGTLGKLTMKANANNITDFQKTYGRRTRHVFFP